MIEIDLLQGGGWGRDGRSRTADTGVRSRRLFRDGWFIGSTLAIIGSLGVGTYLGVSIRARTAGLEEALQAALADSARSAGLIEQMQTLGARRDSIAARVALIQEIDARRYLWPRIMDEVAGCCRRKRGSPGWLRWCRRKTRFDSRWRACRATTSP